MFTRGLPSLTLSSAALNCTVFGRGEEAITYGTLAPSARRSPVARTSNVDGALVMNSWTEHCQSDNIASVKPAIEGWAGSMIVTASTQPSSEPDPLTLKLPISLRKSRGVSGGADA